jgi:dynein light intermediate chain, axonemal
MSNNLPQTQSLVKYDTKIQVSTSLKGRGKSPRKGKQLASIEKAQAEDVLNSILPPRESTEDGQLWVQYVSSTPATRQDVIKLQEDLDSLLEAKQARETGICPIREELYAQCFDELIRQVTINCTERGLLLLRVRDEIRMTIQAYQTLYESSIAFGMRKALQAEQRKENMDRAIKSLNEDCDTLKHEVEDLEKEIADIELREKEREEREERNHQEEVNFKKRANQHLKEQLESLLATPNK